MPNLSVTTASLYSTCDAQVRERVLLSAQGRYDVDPRSTSRLLGRRETHAAAATPQFVNPVRSSVDTPDSPIISPMTDLGRCTPLSP